MTLTMHLGQFVAGLSPNHVPEEAARIARVDGWLKTPVPARRVYALAAAMGLATYIIVYGWGNLVGLIFCAAVRAAIAQKPKLISNPATQLKVKS